MTDKRGTPASTPAGGRRASRKRPESEVNRKGLSELLTPLLLDLQRQGVKQAKAAEMAGCAESVLRKMKNGTGDTHYGYDLLTRAATGLGLPADQLVKTFYPTVARAPALESGTVAPGTEVPGPEAPGTKAPDDEVTVQRMMSHLAPYLARIDDLPGMQASLTEVQEDVAGLRERLDVMARDVHAVRSQLEILIGTSHRPPAG